MVQAGQDIASSDTITEERFLGDLKPRTFAHHMAATTPHRDRGDQPHFAPLDLPRIRRRAARTDAALG